MIDSLEDFKSQLKSFKPDLLVIGGLQMMDSFPFKPGEDKATPWPEVPSHTVPAAASKTLWLLPNFEPL